MGQTATKAVNIVTGNQKRRAWEDAADDAKVLVEASSLMCPVCYVMFSKVPGVLSCGHSLCQTCVKRLLKAAAMGPASLRLIECPMCRMKSQVDKVSKLFFLLVSWSQRNINLG